jgi:hypothetical protein
MFTGNRHARFILRFHDLLRRISEEKNRGQLYIIHYVSAETAQEWNMES